MTFPFSRLSPLLTPWFLGGLTLACSVDFDADGSGGEPASVNECSSDAVCGDGVCSSEGRCESLETALSTVLLEITPPAGTGEIAGVRFTQVVRSARELDLKLQHISHVQATVRGASISSESCLSTPLDEEISSGADGSLDARVTLIPRERLLGLPNPSHSSPAWLTPASEYRVGLAVPPGRYDIYVEPQKNDGSCFRPPYLLLDEEIVSGDVNLKLELPQPHRLDVLVRFPGMIDELSKWTLDIVDRKTGRLLSNQVVLSDPLAVGEALEYRARFAYLPVQAGEEEAGSELLRLTPPSSVTAPQVYFERTVLELFQDGSGVIDQLKSLPRPVTYTGRIARKGTVDPAAASVTLVAREIDSESGGIVTAFTRTVQTDDEGVFEVELLPGSYVVTVQPLDEDLAHASSELTIGQGSPVQAGKVLEVSRRSRLEGQLTSRTGRRIRMVPIEAFIPPRAATLDVLDTARGETPLAPVAQGVTTDETGEFSFLVDPGQFHLVARPDASSGFPWGLRLDVEVLKEKTRTLSAFRLSHPYVMEGELTSRDVGVVPSALIRAYAFLDDGAPTNQPERATSVTAIGEARVDERGSFQLLLPAHID